jgi:hypothetical protein
MKMITLTDDQLDAIVIAELKDALELNIRYDTDEGGYRIDPDRDLVNALKVVLAYYMPPFDASSYIASVETKEREERRRWSPKS